MASLENRGDGTWKIVISNGYDASGKKKRITRTVKVDSSKTERAQRREVEKMAEALEVDFRRHLIADTGKVRFSEVAEEYFSTRNITATTVRGYRYLYGTKIKEAFGKLYVQDITPQQIRQFYKALAKTPSKTARKQPGKLSGTTILHYHRLIHLLLAFAKRNGYISINPADAVEAPHRDTGETAFYELEDCGKLLQVLDSLPDLQWRLFFYMSIYTGMRPGELIGSNWSDVSGSVLTVRAGAAYIKGKGTVRTDRPKTKSSCRLIDLPPVIVSMLAQHKREQAEYRLKFGGGWPEPDAIFTGDEGHRLNISSPTQKWAKIVKTYNLRPITLYGLRHTAASIMIAQGLNARDVAARLGHSQTSTTLNIYAHAFSDANSRATDAIANALEEARKQAKKAE